MLEWYTMNVDYLASLEITEALFERLCSLDGVAQSRVSLLSPPFQRMTIDEAFEKYAGIDLAVCGETESLIAAAEEAGIQTGAIADWSELFHYILVSKVEPELRNDRPVVLLDYPAQVPCLAKLKSNTRRERWELYVCGIELANCFSEAVSLEEVAAYFAEEEPHMIQAGRADQTDKSFPRLYDGKHPECSGVALGIDRLVMTLRGAGSIDEVTAMRQAGDE